MKCIVPSHNVKVMAKAFHSLGKIGDDLFIEPRKHHIAFRTVNMAESAYASFIFTKPFFSSFTFADNDDEETLRCKIAMKSLLVVLKLQQSERLIEWCQIRLDPNGNKVIFQLRYSHGCTKTHFLPILESETLQANYSKQDCKNQLSISPKVLSIVIKNFRATEDEVTVCLLVPKLIIRNHLENNMDSKKALRTEICLYPSEFETYNVGAPTSVTFCLKELRAVLFFAEFTALPVHFYISNAGKPVVFIVNNDTVYEATYVVSTLSESGSSQPLSQTSESSVAISSREPSNTKKRTYKEMDGIEENGNNIEPQTECVNTLMDKLPHNILPQTYENGLNSDHLLEPRILNAPLQCTGPLDTTPKFNITQPVVKSVFGRCFNTTFKKQSLPGYDRVLAYDSDGMEDSD